MTNCLTAGSICRGTEIVNCTTNADNCLVEHVTDCTVGGTVNKTCNAAGPAPACVSCVNDAECIGKAEGYKDCVGNALNVSLTCSDTDGDTCLNAHRENCGSTFTCSNTTKDCEYTGGATCSSATEAVLRHQGSYGPFNTTGGGNDYTAYTCPGLIFAFDAQAPDRLFAVDVAPKTVVTLGLTAPTGFTGTGAWLLLLTNCGDGAMTAEASCKAVSATSVKYANETDADVRIYLLVDADIPNGGTTNVGSFGLTLDTRPFVCGDGKLDGSEACDDGNIFSGDGCTPACALEAGYQCTANSPSVCTQRPANGVCANVMCSAFPATPPNGTQMCCTSKQTCGVAYPFVYGAGCIERDQPGKPDAACPNQPAAFYFPALTGCCRPDNKCGLQALDPSIGTDCVERTEVWLDMQDGYGSLFYSGPFAAMSCTF